MSFWESLFGKKKEEKETKWIVTGYKAILHCYTAITKFSPYEEFKTEKAAKAWCADMLNDIRNKNWVSGKEFTIDTKIIIAADTEVYPIKKEVDENG